MTTTDEVLDAKESFDFLKGAKRERVKVAMEKFAQVREMEIRRTMWANHGCTLPELYMDDGEMQCKCMIDFKRMDISDIIRIISE